MMVVVEAEGNVSEVEFVEIRVIWMKEKNERRNQIYIVEPA